MLKIFQPVCLYASHTRVQVNVNILAFAAKRIDYVFMDATIVFPLGSKPGYTKNITIMVLPDSVVEKTEFFLLSLSADSPFAIIRDGMGNATINIYDNTGELIA